MGLSVGWGDEYPSSIAFQYIDIGGLPYGDYTVQVQTDAGSAFVEADETNNWAWRRSASPGVEPPCSGPVSALSRRTRPSGERRISRQGGSPNRRPSGRR
jgi:hypothetical protein